MSKWKRGIALVLVLLAGLWQWWDGQLGGIQGGVAELVQQRASGVWVETDARVIKLLPDDNDGSRHQRFLVDAGAKRPVLVAHNIDLAKKVPIKTGDSISLRGRFEWNDKGGVIHWTHHDPSGRVGGWIRAAGATFE